MGLISVSDLDDRRVEYADDAQALAAIEDASSVARAYVAPTFDTLERDGAPGVPGAVVAIVVGMVRRLLTNPRGLSMETLGDYTYQTTANVATLLPTIRERRMLRSAAGAFAVATGAGAPFPAYGASSVYMRADLPAVSEGVGV